MAIWGQAPTVDVLITKGKHDFQVQYLGSVAFVPMTGAAQKS